MPEIKYGVLKGVTLTDGDSASVELKAQTP
jgi:hypothetical protein